MIKKYLLNANNAKKKCAFTVLNQLKLLNLMDHNFIQRHATNLEILLLFLQRIVNLAPAKIPDLKKENILMEIKM